MMENMISVVVTTYNQEGTISRTLDSILMQQCHVPFEIVIGEDCSTDNTRVICDSYAQKHPDIIRLICNQQNKGTVNNYFDCLLEARGQYIADCAGDDWWTDTSKLEKEVTLMEQHPSVNIVLTRWNWYNVASKKLTPCFPPPFSSSIVKGHDALEAIITQTNMSVFHLCTSLYRRDVFLKAYHEYPDLFRNSQLVTEDIQLMFMMAYYGDIAYLPDVTLNYSIGFDTVSNTADDVKQFRFVRKTTELILYLATKYQINISQSFPDRIFALGMHAFRAHQPQLYKDTLICEQNWKFNRPLKNKILFTVMGNEWLWSLALIVRRAFVWLKQLFR